MTEASADMDAAALKEEGNAKFKAKDYAAAVEAYTRSLEKEPNQHLCYSNRSAAYLKLGNSVQEALSDAKRCVELQPAWGKGYNRLASALVELGKWDEAADACRKGIEVGPDSKMHEDMLVTVEQRRFQEGMLGTWHGRVSDDLGGYDQEMEFCSNWSVRIEVLGRGLVGRYWLDCSQSPVWMQVQVPHGPPPEQFPGVPPMPPAPPVPYIVKADAKGLHLCCPYKEIDRPKAFEGPGYVLMTKGAVPQSDDKDLSKLSLAEKQLQCVRELLPIIPNEKMPELSQNDTEEAQGEKLMLQLRFEAKMYRVTKRFGEDLCRDVLSATKGGAVPEALLGSSEFKELTDRMQKAGAWDPTPPPAASAANPSEGRPSSFSPPETGTSKPSSRTTPPRSAQEGGPGDEGMCSPTIKLAIGVSLVLGIAGLVGGLAQMRRRT